MADSIDSEQAKTQSGFRLILPLSRSLPWAETLMCPEYLREDLQLPMEDKFEKEQGEKL